MTGSVGKTMRSVRKALASALVVALLTALGTLGMGTPAAYAQGTIDVHIMGSVIGGIGYAFATGVARTITQSLPNARVTIEATNGYVDSAKRLHAGFGNMGIVAHDTARLMAAGEGDFARRGATLYAAFPVHTLDWHVIVPADSPIRSIKDLAGQRVSVQPRGSTAETMSSAIFKALGIDIRPEYLPHAEAAEAMRTGQIAAHALAGAASVWQEFALRTPIRILSLTPEESAAIVAAAPHLTPVRYPADQFYQGVEPVDTVSLWAIWMVRSDLDEDTVYAITKGVYDHRNLVEAAHPQAAFMRPEQILDLTVPIHPGAARYFRELGIDLPDSAVGK
ncbi:MAG: TAXI family TRAP transporter solute-binding subunit [Clostridia bacterium]